MKQCAFLSTDNLEDFFVYDRLLVAPMAEQGWQVSEVSWRDSSVNWDNYDVVVIRSTWDYQQDPQAFMRCLQNIDASRAVLANSLQTVNWNIHKGYLRDLQQQGVPVVPTLWFSDYNKAEVAAGFSHFNTQELVIKPQLSANADDTFRFTKAQLQGLDKQFLTLFSQRDFMLQPFLSSIVENGEYSLFYFAGNYSHCILKTPQQDDFRVQEEHGGQLTAVEATPRQKALAQQTLQALPQQPLYARIDLAQTDIGLAIMEVELIEPSLYFNMDKVSIQVFVDAFVGRYGGGH